MGRENVERRIEATKGLLKEAWVVIFWPFGILGLIAGQNLKSFLAGCGIGFIFFVLLLLTMRYGKEA